MSKKPSISVLMPVYNTEKYVAEAVESVLCQTFDDFEFLIIDDGSSDDSLKILKHYAEKDRRIRLVSRPNTGYVVALNEMLQLAQGKYVARMDADDVALPDRFAKQVEYIEQHPDCGAVGTSVLQIDSDGDPIQKVSHPLTHEEIDSCYLEGIAQISHPSVMMRREVVERIGGYRDEYRPAEDVDLFLRLAECAKVANLPDVLLKYRQHLTSQGYVNRQHQIRSANMAVNSARLRRGLPPLERNKVEAIYQATTAEHYRKWSWWALGGGHMSTARKYAIAAVRQQPFSLESWRAMYCSLRGY